MTASTTAAPASPWRRVLSVALFAAAASAVLIQVLAATVIPPLLVFAVVFVAVGVALRRGTAAWLEWLALALGVLMIVASVPFAAEDLAHPESVAGFAPSLATLLAALFVVVASAMARRHSVAAARPLATGFVGIALLGAVASAAISAGVEDDERQTGDVVVVAKSVAYPERVESPAGEVTFFVENEDVVRHTFLIEGTDVATELPGSSDRRVEVTLEPGEYRYFCDVAGHEDMEGTLVVE